MLPSEGGGQAELQGTHCEEEFPLSENATGIISTEGTSTAKNNLRIRCLTSMSHKNSIFVQRIQNRDHRRQTIDDSPSTFASSGKFCRMACLIFTPLSCRAETQYPSSKCLFSQPL